jgi:hypothetical protein
MFKFEKVKIWKMLLFEFEKYLNLKLFKSEKYLCSKNVTNFDFVSKF